MSNIIIKSAQDSAYKCGVLAGLKIAIGAVNAEMIRQELINFGKSPEHLESIKKTINETSDVFLALINKSIEMEENLSK